MSGQFLSFICPAFGAASDVWGTGTYTSDSSPCTAAVLEGKLTLAAGGTVNIQMAAGKSSYKGSAAHGITSNSYGSYSSSFTVVAASPAAAVVGYGGSGWETGTTGYSSFIGTRISFGCPAGGTASSVWGTGSYTADSSVCTAAVLEGKITLASGGSVTVQIIPGQSSYKGSTSNGVTSNSYGSYNGGFTIVGATRSVPSPSPGGTGWNTDPSSFRSAGAAGWSTSAPRSASRTRSGARAPTPTTAPCARPRCSRGRSRCPVGGTVTIELRPGQSSYKATSGNGIKSSSYASWGGSFVIIGANARPAEIGDGGTGWNATPGSYTKYLDSHFAYACPAKGTPGGVWGTGTYTSDSSVCTAAVHSGLISVAAGGTVTVEIKPGQSSYKGSTANGVKSNSYGPWLSSYVLLGAKVGGAGSTGSPGTGGGGGGSPPSVSQPPPAPTGPLSPPLPAPVSGSSIDLKTLTGTVLVNGKPFTAGQQVKVGATVNATKGTITMTSAGPGGALETANFSSGQFKVTQKGKTGITQLSLGAGDFSACKRTTSAAKPPSTKIVRAVWGNGHGHFTTTGRYAAATVRGTTWLTEDRCDGTLIVVKRGVVTVVDKVRHKTVTVTAGHSYLVPA